MANAATIQAAQKAAGIAAGRAAAPFPSASSGKPERRAGLRGISAKRKRRTVYTNAKGGIPAIGNKAKPGPVPAHQSLGKPAMNMQQAHARLAKRLAGS